MNSKESPLQPSSPTGSPDNERAAINLGIRLSALPNDSWALILYRPNPKFGGLTMKEWLDSGKDISVAEEVVYEAEKACAEQLASKEAPQSEKQKFLERIASLKAKGLRFLNIFHVKDPKKWTKTSTLENDVYAELNRMEEAKNQPDPEVLGKYSP